jgi:hypothetical protein
MVAMSPVCKLILAVAVGERTLAMAQRLVHQVTQVLAPECAPLFLTDGFGEYLKAIVAHYGQWIQPERRQAKGPRPKPRWMPLPGLLYAQVVKSYRWRRIVGVKYRVIFGVAETIESILAKRGWTINTSFIERLNLDLRQYVALFQIYYDFVLPHAGLRLPLSCSCNALIRVVEGFQVEVGHGVSNLPCKMIVGQLRIELVPELSAFTPGRLSKTSGYLSIE